MTQHHHWNHHTENCLTNDSSMLDFTVNCCDVSKKHQLRTMLLHIPRFETVLEQSLEYELKFNAHDLEDSKKVLG